MADPTTYFALSGHLTKEEGGEDVPLSPEEAEEVLGHLLRALSPYEGDRWFRFVDIGASGTLATGEVRLEWSNYGLVRPQPKEE